MKVLLTGATGLLGQHLTRKLSEDGHQVFPLVHRRLVEDGRSHLLGDVTLPRFGLQDLPQIDALVHSAGLVSFSRRHRDALDRVNIQGTRHAADLAKELGVPLFHISTAYVCGDHKGVMKAHELDVKQTHHNDYERSKYQAEQHIRRQWGLTWTVFRPSLLVGDSKVVGVPPLHGFYVAVRAIALTKRWLERSLALPGLTPRLRLRADPEATLNLIPVDLAAREVADVIADGHPGTYPVVNQHPPTIRQICYEASAALEAQIIPCLSFDPNPAERLLERLIGDLLPYLQGEPEFTPNPESPLSRAELIPQGFVESTTRLFLAAQKLYRPGG